LKIMGSDGGWLRTASPTSAEHESTQREAGRLVLKPPPSVSMRLFPEIRFGKRYNASDRLSGSCHRAAIKRISAPHRCDGNAEWMRAIRRGRSAPEL
jgi:hypothetical protein